MTSFRARCVLAARHTRSRRLHRRPSSAITLANNTYYVPAGGNLSLGCGDRPAAFRDYASMGWETNATVVRALPSSAQIVAWARALLP